MYQPHREPLARIEDALEYEQGLENYVLGLWDEARWTAFRVRYGVYGQRQADKHMIRLKVPGGLLKTEWLPVIAEVLRRFAEGSAHVTTRQDIQIYGVDLENTAPLLRLLNQGGVGTREAGGNSVRNVTACRFAGLCPAERVDAALVAEQISGLWLRRPLSQRMPRKFKIAVSGCAHDCAGGWYHDLAFVAAQRDGVSGFRVLGGGGLGARPMPGIELFDFVTEADVPAVIEAVLRVHQHRSDRGNKGASRFKFTVRRLNAKEIRDEVGREFEVAARLAQPPSQPIVWKAPFGEKPASANGTHRLGDGRFALVFRPVNGALDALQIESLYGLAKTHGLADLRLTTAQEVVLLGLDKDDAALARLWLRSLEPSDSASVGGKGDVMGCLGVSTCPIGVVNAAGLVRELEKANIPQGVGVRVSGCHNACAQHHVADIGLHGVTRLVKGHVVPHYQLHLGGDMTRPDGLAIEGPVLPARQAPKAIERLANAMKARRPQTQSVRQWAEALGAQGLAALVDSALAADDPINLVDWGEKKAFAGPATGKGDCSAPQISNDHLSDLAKDALERMDRALQSNLWELALREAERAISLSTQRRLELDQRSSKNSASLPQAERLRLDLRYRPELIDAFEQLEAARELALVTGQAYDYRRTVADWLELLESVPSVPQENSLERLERMVAGL